MTIEFRSFKNLTGVTATTVNAGVTGERSYLTDLVVTNVGTTASEVAILSSATEVASFWSATATTVNHAFKIPIISASGEPLNVKAATVSDIKVTATGQRK